MIFPWLRFNLLNLTLSFTQIERSLLKRGRGYVRVGGECRWFSTKILQLVGNLYRLKWGKGIFRVWSPLTIPQLGSWNYSIVEVINFVEFLKIRVRGEDKLLEQHLKNYIQNANYISKPLQNHLISCCWPFITASHSFYRSIISFDFLSSLVISMSIMI